MARTLRQSRTWRLGAMAVAYVVLASVLTHLPLGHRTARLVGLIDKPLHFALYAGMVVLFLAAFGRSRRAIVVAVGIAVAMASLDEVLQSTVPSRTVDWRDWIAGVAGAVLVGAVALLLPAPRPIRTGADETAA